jgi:hypothetical protein
MTILSALHTPSRILRLSLATILALSSALPIAATAQASAPAKPAPDTVVFNNGDSLTGKLIRGSGNSIVFKSDMAGEITISLDKVKELHTTGKFAVLRKDHPIKSIAAARAIMPAPIAYSGGHLLVSGPQPTATPEVVPEAQIANIIDQDSFAQDTDHPGLLSGWKGSLSGGATLVRATDYGETFSAGIALSRSMPQVAFLPARNRTSFNLQETYGKLTSPVIPQTTPPSPPAVTVTSIFHTDAERDEYFSARFYALGQTAFDHNYSQGLQLQRVFGGGVGWTALKSDRQELDLKGSVQYEKQEYLATSASPNQNIVGSTLSEAYRRSLPRKLLFTQTLSALPAWNNTRDYSANGSVALAMPLFKRLSLLLTTTDNYLNDPALGYNRNSFQFVTAASYSIR